MSGYGGFVLLAALLALVPGPDSAVVLGNTLSGGGRRGMWAALGITSSNVLQGAAAAAGLGVVVVTGVARSVDELGGWRPLVTTGFGRALLVKLVLFAGLVAVGAGNHYRLVPALAAGTGRLARLHATVTGELGLASAVLLAAAVLGGLPPGATTPRPPTVPATPGVVVASGSDYTTSVRVALRVTPGTAGPNRFVVSLADYDTGTPVAAKRVRLTGRLPAQPEVGPFTSELARAGEGRWQAQGSLLSIQGRWRLTVLVEGGSGAFSVPLQVTVGAPGPPSTQRR